MALEFNELLDRARISPDETAVILHTPDAPRLRRLICWSAEERRDLFEVYQSTHSPKAEATLRNRRYAASFVNLGDRSFLFVGLYLNQDGERIANNLINRMSGFVELRRITEFPVLDENSSSGGSHIVFNLKRITLLEEFAGRLRVAAPRAARPYMRLAENLHLDVLSLTEQSFASSLPPDWRDIALTASDLQALPGRWADKLSEWRGVYLIVDEEDGARYVGSAYGDENLLGRWRAHIGGDTGITAELRRRATGGFRFSILERLSPDAEPVDVITAERRWMNRLHTIEHGLNF